MAEATCGVPECEKPARRRGLCSMHEYRLRVHGSLEKPPKTQWPRGKARPDFIPKHPAVCTAEGCERPSKVRGLCSTHYLQFRENDGVLTPIAPRRANRGTTCKSDGCDREARTRHWCQVHYMEWRRTGQEPTGPVAPPCGSKEVVSYGGVHARLRRRIGEASKFRCVDCDQPASDWSYDNEDPDELIGENVGRMMRYSLKPEHYTPRCRGCHARYDEGSAYVGDHSRCSNGHLATGDNTYVRPSGAPVCRDCRRVTPSSLR